MSDSMKWLKSLKVGDVVCVESYNGARSIRKIRHITNTGRFKTEGYDNLQFDHRGVQITSASYKRQLVPVTPEILEEVSRIQAVSFIAHVRWSEVSTQQILDIMKILNRGEANEARSDRSSEVPT